MIMKPDNLGFLDIWKDVPVHIGGSRGQITPLDIDSPPIKQIIMTADQFNEKYKQYIPDAWSGLQFDIPEVTTYLDGLMEDLITIPGFELNQIKMKFGMARFYFDSKWADKHLESALEFSIEKKINEIVKKLDNANT